MGACVCLDWIGPNEIPSLRRILWNVIIKHFFYDVLYGVLASWGIDPLQSLHSAANNGVVRA
jgi:hypothetical protein